MELGEGVFLGFVLVALTILYVQTKDRWNWKRVASWSVGVVVVIGGSAAGFSWWWDHTPHPPSYPEPEYVTSFLDLEVGASKTDVLFREGEPDAKFIAPDKPDELWAYGPDRVQRILLRFKNERLVSISAEHTCPSPSPSRRDCGALTPLECAQVRALDSRPPIIYNLFLNRVHLCTSLDLLVKKLGEPDSTFDMKGGLWRRYDYTKSYNVSYIIEKSIVISMTAGDP